MIDTKIVLAVDPERTVRLSPHRFRYEPSNLIVIEDSKLRIDLHLTYAQLQALYEQVRWVGAR